MGGGTKLATHILLSVGLQRTGPQLATRAQHRLLEGLQESCPHGTDSNTHDHKGYAFQDPNSVTQVPPLGNVEAEDGYGLPEGTAQGWHKQTLERRGWGEKNK